MDRTEQTLVYSYNLIKEGNFTEAKEKLSVALSSDLENQEIVYALKCLNYWSVSVLLNTPPTPDQVCIHANAILDHWHQFSSFIARDPNRFDRCILAFSSIVFSVVAKHYLSVLGGQRWAFI